MFETKDIANTLDNIFNDIKSFYF